MQLKMGQEVSEAVTSAKEVGQTIMKCLNRDPDWVAYHASELAEAAHSPPVDVAALRIAGGERLAFRQQRLGQFEPALQTIEKLIADKDLVDDRQRRAWLSALAARIAYQMEDEDRGQKLQTNAFGVNNNHSPPKVRPTYVPRPAPGKQSHAITARILEYDRRGAMIADFDEDVAELVPEAPTGRYEEALANLGAYLGFEAERPEKVYRVGPDVLWRTDATFDFIIEAKSDKEEDSPLYKRDHAQLLEAEHWFKNAYPGRVSVRVSALPQAVADEKATPAGTYALRLREITKLVGALRGILLELVGCPGGPDALRDRCEVALQKAKLKPDAILATYMQPFDKVTPKRS